MGITVLTTSSGRIRASCIALLCLLPTASLGAEIDGEIRVGVSHTDNVLLTASPNEIDDIVLQASPSFSLVHESHKLDAEVEYAFDWFRYADLETTSRYHRGEAKLAGKLWQDSLVTELGARRSQRLGDPNGVIPQGRLPLSTNLVDQDEWWINPRLNRTLGRAVTLGTDYRYSRVQFDDSETQDNTNQSGDFSLENYKAGQGLTWAARYSWRRTEYEISIPWEYQQANVELGFWVNEKTRVFGARGKESAWNNPFDSSMTDPFWEAGFAHNAGEKFSVEIAAGERSFGTSSRWNIAYTFRRGNTSVSYSESPTTIGYDNSGARRNELQPGDLDSYLGRPGSAERYLSKTFKWDLNLEFRRTGFGLVVFSEERSDRVSAFGSLAGGTLDDQSQNVARASFSWQVGARTELTAIGLLVEQETGVGNESEFASAGLKVNYRLGSHSNLLLGYYYNEQQPTGQNSTGFDYVANVVSLFFTVSL